jgi:hypothetical protein
VGRPRSSAAASVAPDGAAGAHHAARLGLAQPLTVGRAQPLIVSLAPPLAVGLARPVAVGRAPPQGRGHELAPIVPDLRRFKLAARADLGTARAYLGVAQRTDFRTVAERVLHERRGLRRHDVALRVGIAPRGAPVDDCRVAEVHPRAHRLLAPVAGAAAHARAPPSPRRFVPNLLLFRLVLSFVFDSAGVPKLTAGAHDFDDISHAPSERAVLAFKPRISEHFQ